MSDTNTASQYKPFMDENEIGAIVLLSWFN